jgi:hypothetical protein
MLSFVRAQGSPPSQHQGASLKRLLCLVLLVLSLAGLLTGCGEESESRPWIGSAPGAVRPWPSERDLSTRQRSFQPE